MRTVKQAAEEIGVRPATLRAWDRRYQLSSSTRSAGGYRLYDDADIERLRMLRALVVDGFSIGEAAELVRRGHGGLEALPDPKLVAEDFLAGRISAAEVRHWLRVGSTLTSFAAVADAWLLPMMHNLAHSWTTGSLPMDRRHELVFELSGQLMAIAARHEVPEDAPGVLLGVPEGARFRLGALAFSVAAVESGLRATYLDAMPVDGWRHALRTRPERVLALAVPTPADVPAARRLLRALADEPVLLGAGGPAHREVADLALPLGQDNRTAVPALHRAIERANERADERAGATDPPARPGDPGRAPRGD